MVQFLSLKSIIRMESNLTIELKIYEMLLAQKT